MQETPSPYRTLSFRVPVVSRRAVAVVAGVAVLGAAAAGGVHLLRHRASAAETAAARSEVAPLADQTLSRSRDELARLAGDVPSLSRRLDDDLGAPSSRAIDVNADLARQGDLQRRLAAVGDDLGALDRRQEISRLAHRLPGGTPLLTDAEAAELKALQARQADLAKQVAAFDGRIALAAQRREDLAKVEKEARSEAAMAHAVESQAQATGQPPEQVAAAVASPVVISSPGAKTDAQKKAMGDAIAAQAAATGQTPDQVAAQVDTQIAPAPANPAPESPQTSVPAQTTADNTPPPPPAPPQPPAAPQPTVVVQQTVPSVYYYPAPVYYPYRPYYYYRPGPSIIIHTGSGHNAPPYGNHWGH